MKKIVYTLFLAGSFYYSANAQSSNQTKQDLPVSGTSLYKVGVGYGSSLYSNMETFEFVLNGGEKISLTAATPIVYFSQQLAAGQSYSITQVSGPRSCNLWGMNTGKIANADVLVSVDCGHPSLTTFKLNVRGIESGETFSFADNYNRTFRTAFSTLAGLGGFPVADHYTIIQTDGPRKCIITPSSGSVPDAPLTIQCDCRKTAGTDSTAAPAKLRGTFASPPGTKIILRLNSADSLVLAQPANASNLWVQTMNFSFPKSYPAGTEYNMSIKSAPANLGCVITENGTGRISESAPLVRVLCDKKIYEHVSRSTDNKIISTYYESFNAVIGGKGEDEGRFVAFGAYGKGMDGSSGNHRQIFWRDRKTGVTKLISKPVAGAEANGDCQMPAISADGKTVAFESYATNLTVNDNNGARDVYVWSEKTGTVNLVSMAQQGGTPNGESLEPTVSGDGTVIAYTSHASNIVTLGPVFSTPNVYVYQQGGGTDFISKDYETGKAAGGSSVPSISEDGTAIAFCGYTSRLVNGDNNNLWDIFLWQKAKAQLKRISLTATGGERNQGTESASRVVAPSISGNGKYVAFATTATNMVSGDNNNVQDVFVVSTETGAVVRASVDAAGKEGNNDCPIGQGEKVAISFDGTWTAFSVKATNLGVPENNIVLHNSIAGKTIAVTNITGSSVGVPAMSMAASYVIFGMGTKLDNRVPSSGIFTAFTNISGTRSN